MADDTWDPPRPGWRCEECGFDYDGTDPVAVAETVRGFGRRFRAPLTRGLPGEDLLALLRTRPAPDRWSALEYAAHARDAFALYDERIGRALSDDRPTVPPMRRDEIVSERRYNESDPAEVADQLAATAAGLADRIAGLGEADWDRAVVRDGTELTVAWMARNAVHEGSHHLLDVGRTLREVRGR